MATENQSYDLQAGDIVRLKSGGPAMTISSVNGNEADLIYWNDATNEFQTWEEINLIALVKSEVN